MITLTLKLSLTLMRMLKTMRKLIFIPFFKNLKQNTLIRNQNLNSIVNIE